MHLHLFPSSQIIKEGEWSLVKLEKNLISLSQKLKNFSIQKGLVIILDTNFLKNNGLTEYLKNANKKFSNLSFCLMLDFRKPDFKNFLHLAKNLGIKAIKIHPRLQKITQNDFRRVGNFAKEAEKLGFFIVIDCTFSKKGSYKYNGIKLASYLDNLISCPIIMAHSGGALILDALNVGMNSNNLYLETSFSLMYWRETNVEQDIAFSFKRLGSNRCLYGSDVPFVKIEDSIKITNDFFKKYNFSKKDINNIMYNTANRIFNINFNL